MKNQFMHFKFSFFLLLIISLVSCAPQQKNTLTIAHFNDVYEISPPSGSTYSRMSQASTFIKELKKNHSPVITTLGGDYLSPSAIGASETNGEVIAGKQMVDVLNTMGLQFAVLGNHEFDIEEEQFLQRLTESKFHIVTSNVTDKDGKAFPNTQRSAVAMVRLGNRMVKIGIIGITIDFNLKPYVKYADDIESARAQIAALGKVDAIIALTHLTLERDQNLVKALPEIDLVLGGHEHDNWLLYRGDNLTPIVKADSNLKTLAVVQLEFLEGNSRPKISTALQKIDDKIPADQVIEERVHEWQKIAFEGFKANGFEPKKIIAQLPESLDGRESENRSNPTNLSKLIAQTMLNKTNAEVAVFNGGMIRIDDILPAGPITQYDIIRTIPRENQIVSTNIKGSLLEEMLNIGVIKNRATGAYYQVLGVMQKDNKWFINDKLLDRNKEYFVATNSSVSKYLLSKNYELKNVKEHGDIRHALIEELARKYPIESSGKVVENNL